VRPSLFGKLSHTIGAGFLKMRPPALKLAVTKVTQITHSPQVARAEIVKVEVYFFSGQS